MCGTLQPEKAQITTTTTTTTSNDDGNGPQARRQQLPELLLRRFGNVSGSPCPYRDDDIQMVARIEKT